MWLVSWLVWLPACLEPCVLAGWCVPGSCPWLKWLPAYLEPRVLGWCVLAGWCALVGSGYLHTLNLVSLVGAGSCALVRVVRAGWCGYLHTLNLVSLVRVPCWCPGWK